MNKSSMNPSPTDPTANGVRQLIDAAERTLSPSGDDRRDEVSGEKKNLSKKPSTSSSTISAVVPNRVCVRQGKRMAPLRRASLQPGRSLPPRKRKNNTSNNSHEETNESNGKDEAAAIIVAKEPPSLIPEQPAQFSTKPRSSAFVACPTTVNPSHDAKESKRTDDRPKSAPTLLVSVPSPAAARARPVPNNESLSSSAPGILEDPDESESRPKSAPTVLVTSPVASVARDRDTTNGCALPEAFLTSNAAGMPPPTAHSCFHPSAQDAHGGNFSCYPPTHETDSIMAGVPSTLSPYDPSRNYHHSQNESTDPSSLPWAYGHDSSGMFDPSLSSDERDGNVSASNEDVGGGGGDDDEAKDANDANDEDAEEDSDMAACVVDIAISVTQNGGVVLKDKKGKPVALVDSDSADVSALFRKHKVQVTNLTAADGDNIPALTLRALATAAPPTSRQRKFQRWTEEEDELLRKAIDKSGPPPFNWSRISRRYFRGIRTSVQCKNRWTKILKPDLKKTPFSTDEDDIVRRHKEAGGDNITWAQIAKFLPGRNRDQVRERWQNALDPTLKRNVPWSEEENKKLFALQSTMGNKWTEIAKLLPGRSENQVKNRWHNAKTSQRRMMKNLAKEAMLIERMEEARNDI